MRFSLELTDSDFEEKGWTRPSTVFWFDVDMPFAFGSDEWVDWDDEQLLEQASDLESEYGVHDYYASGLPTGEWTEFGYHSYEIKQDKWEELVGKWHEWFTKIGWSPSVISSLPVDDYAAKFF